MVALFKGIEEMLEIKIFRPSNHPIVQSGRIGVLLVNLGTPDATDYWSIRRYLKEFLSDPRVIEVNRLLWWLLLNFVILPIRPHRKRRDYDKIWNRERNESPLKTITRSQSEKLQMALATVNSRIIVDWGMRYGNPPILSRLDALQEQGCDRILVVPMYPQYAAATTATVCDEVLRGLVRKRWQPSLRFAPPYYDNPIYIEALAESLQTEIENQNFKPQVIIASFHGMPQEYLEKGDPYYCQCAKTARLLRETLKLKEDQFLMTFQSRFGTAEWLKPYTDITVRNLAESGVKNIAIITPGFTSDCLCRAR